MLVDLMPGPSSSAPTGFGRVGNYTLFWAFGGGEDRELWRTDGTVEGTMKVHPPPDRLFGSRPFRFVEAGGISYFTSRTGDGRAILWRTDGTAEGTNFVADGVAGAFLPEGGLYVGVGNTLFFAALGGVWKTDGRRDGTVSVIPNPGTVLAMVDFGGRLAFLADGDSRRSLWISDGTTAGSGIVKSWDRGPQVFNRGDLLSLGGFLYFAACETATGCELWRTDGTPMGTALAADIWPGRESGAPHNFVAAGGRLLFLSEGSEDRISRILSFDPVGKVVESLISLYVGSPYYLDLALLDSTFLIQVRGYDAWGDPSARMLIISNGTPSGTRVFSGPDGTPVYPTSNLAERSRDVLLGAYVAGLPGLFSVDKGTAAMQKVSEAPAASEGSEPSAFTTMNGTTFFAAYGPTSRELWRTDGTTAGTSRLAGVELRVLAPPDHSRMLSFGGRLFFNGCDDIHGCELWSTDGTAPGTSLFKDLLPDPQQGDPRLVAASGDHFFFMTWSPDGTQHVIWQSDGTPDGTAIASGSAYPFWDVDWPGRALGYRGALLLPAQSLGGGCGLARADPRAGTISMLRQFMSGDDYGCPHGPSQLLEMHGQAFFVTSEDPAVGQPNLWTSDGTSEGTRPVLDNQGARLRAALLAATAGRLFFLPGGGGGLWKSDGSRDGTALVRYLPQWSPESGASFEMVTVGETLFFTWSDAEHGSELWKSDGTAEGTGLVKDIRPGALGSFPHSLTAAGGRLYFAASDGLHGVELWTSDGTETGTVMVQDIALGAASSNPADLTATCGALFFAANDGLVGGEPWVLPLPAEFGRDPTCHRVVTGPATGTPVRRDRP
jgi:ELWxxDGT repeat protein